LLSEDSCLLEGLQSADKTNTHPKAKLQNWVYDYACGHLQADCLESGISSGPLSSITSMGNLYL